MFFFFSSRRRHTRYWRDWSSDVCSSDLEKMGVDFWWLDWQQWSNDKQFPNLSNTWWLNYATFSDMERHRDTRPMLYHRWGGLGNHRYQIDRKSTRLNSSHANISDAVFCLKKKITC